MPISIITKEDLQEFKQELFEELRTLLPVTSVAPKRWLRSYEVRQMLNISIGTLQNLRISNTLHPQKIGHLHYYDYEEIAKLLQPATSNHHNSIARSRPPIGSGSRKQ